MEDHPDRWKIFDREMEDHLRLESTCPLRAPPSLDRLGFWPDRPSPPSSSRCRLKKSLDCLIDCQEMSPDRSPDCSPGDVAWTAGVVAITSDDPCQEMVVAIAAPNCLMACSKRDGPERWKISDREMEDRLRLDVIRVMWFCSVGMVKADKYGCFDGHISSPQTPKSDQDAQNSLEYSSGCPMTYGSPDEMFLKDLNPCLTPYFSKTKSKEFIPDDLFSCQGGILSKSLENCQPLTRGSNTARMIYKSDESKWSIGKPKNQTLF